MAGAAFLAGSSFFAGSPIFAGSAGFGYPAIAERIERSPARDRIRVLGYVTPEELADWYSRASIFAFPSLDEGFSMPVLDAMARGVPVVTSNRSAMPEVAGDAALLVDPENDDAITEALRSLASDRTQQNDLRARGLARARQFSWDNTVDATWRVYEELF